MGTLLIASVAAVIALGQMRQARRLREEEAAPFVVVDVVPGATSRYLLELSIENIGKTIARDVRIKIEPPVASTMDESGYPLRDWAPLKEGIRTLAPGRRYASLFDSSFERHDSKLPRRYEVTFDCRDSRDRPQPTLSTTIDLEPLYGALHVDEKGVHQLVQEVEKLRKATESIAKQTWSVEVYDGEARDAKREKAREERRRHWEEVAERTAETRPDLAGVASAVAEGYEPASEPSVEEAYEAGGAT